MPFGPVEQAISDIAAGRMVIVADDEDRENEGDLICAAQRVTPEIINFMTKRASGLLCLALTSDRCDQLGLVPVSENNIDAYRTAYTQSVDAAPRFGITTGISAQDRATTIRVAVGTCFRCARVKAVCSSASATPKPLSISLGSLDSFPRTCASGDTCSRSGRERAVSCSAWGTRKRPWTSLGSRVSIRRA